MTINPSKNKVISKVVSRKVLDFNNFALTTYDYYRRTADIIDRTNRALGRKVCFKTNIESTITCKINHNKNATTA